MKNQQKHNANYVFVRKESFAKNCVRLICDIACLFLYFNFNYNTVKKSIFAEKVSNFNENAFFKTKRHLSQLRHIRSKHWIFMLLLNR